MIFENKVNKFIKKYETLDISYRNSEKVKECLGRFVYIFYEITDYFKKEERNIYNYGRLKLKDRIENLRNIIRSLENNL